MTYHLGIDLGTTYTAAAIHDGGRVEVVPLGNRGPSIPSVLYLKADGNVVAGDAANRHAVTDPQRVAREFKRRLGDPTPVMLGSTPTPPETLMGHLLRWVYDMVVRAKGAPPTTVVLTHPANWGPYKRDLLRNAAASVGLSDVALITEPQAAAISYASQARCDPGSIVAVYDLGGGTFDAAVLRKEADGTFSILGTPEGIERLGGIDFDAGVFALVRQTLEGVFDDLDPDDESTMAAVARLRQECTQAKEALSLDTEATIPVLLPTSQTEVRCTRAEFESMIRPPLRETVTALERALRSANLAVSDVSHVLLVGGSSRIPLVAQLVSEQLTQPVAVDAHPKHAVALGAAIVAAREAGLMVGDAAMTGAGTVSGLQPAHVPTSTRPATPPAATTPNPARQPDAVVPAATPAERRGATPTRVMSSNDYPNLGAQGPQQQRPAPPAAPQTDPRPAPPPQHQQPDAAGPYGASAPPPPGPGWDPTFDAARGEAPAPSLGYRAASMPPAPGTSHDLPPGYRPAEHQAFESRQKSNKTRNILITLAILGVGVIGLLFMVYMQNKPDSLAAGDVGTCFNLKDEDSVNFNEVDKVDCEEAHRFELIGVVSEADGEPDAACIAKIEEYYGGTQQEINEQGLDVFPQTTKDGTETFCLGGLENGDKSSGSIKGDGGG